jgi:hypothetical protein
VLVEDARQSLKVVKAKFEFVIPDYVLDMTTPMFADLQRSQQPDPIPHTKVCCFILAGYMHGIHT